MSSDLLYSARRESVTSRCVVLTRACYMYAARHDHSQEQSRGKSSGFCLTRSDFSHNPTYSPSHQKQPEALMQYCERVKW
jgi:hypothetical protein